MKASYLTLRSPYVEVAPLGEQGPPRRTGPRRGLCATPRGRPIRMRGAAVHVCGQLQPGHVLQGAIRLAQDQRLLACLRAADGNRQLGRRMDGRIRGRRKPTAADFLSFGTSQPFVFAEVGQLSSTASNELSYDSLRDFFLPVTSTARSNASSEGFPLTNFQQIRDEVLTPGQGVHGVRETFDYTYTGGITDTFDEVALTNADQTVVYLRAGTMWSRNCPARASRSTWTACASAPTARAHPVRTSGATGASAVTVWPNGLPHPRAATSTARSTTSRSTQRRLTVTQIDQHYTLSGRARTLPPAPSDLLGSTVANDNPDLYWRLDDASGTTAADSSRYNSPGTYSGAGITYHAASTVTGPSGTGVAFNGSTGTVGSNSTYINPTSYSEEAWFRTTSTAGGKIIGFGSSRSGNSVTHDRDVYLLSTGQLVFGVDNSSPGHVTTPKRLQRRALAPGRRHPGQRRDESLRRRAAGRDQPEHARRRTTPAIGASAATRVGAATATSTARSTRPRSGCPS